MALLIIFILILCVTIVTVSLVTYFVNRDSTPMKPNLDYIETNNFANTQETLYVEFSVEGEGFISWGDGTTTPIVMGTPSQSHTYSSFGDYKIKFEGKITNLVLGGQSFSIINNTYLNLLQCPNLLALGFAGISDLKGLEKLSKLQILGFKNISIPVTLPTPSSLETLQISESQIPDLVNFSQQTHLTSLTINIARIESVGTDFNTSFAPFLNRVNLSGSDFTSLIVPSSVNNINIVDNQFQITELNDLATLLNTFGQKSDAELSIYGNPGAAEVDDNVNPWSELISNGWSLRLTFI